MLDPTIIVAIIGFSGLFIERALTWSLRVKNSSCTKKGIEVEMQRNTNNR